MNHYLIGFLLGVPVGVFAVCAFRLCRAIKRISIDILDGFGL